jgi:maintenance of mitochondrial morphology protein 1
MSSSYIFTLEPTFTQGLVLGQLFILTLLALILRYLFLDSTKYPFETPSYHPRVDKEPSSRRPPIFTLDSEETRDGSSESAKWFNALMEQVRHAITPATYVVSVSESAQVMETYRTKLCDSLLDEVGLEIARKRIEDFANAQRPPGFIVRT